MESTATSPSSQLRPGWREVVWPREHGSWSLAFEPVALALLAAPSFAGGAFAVAVIAGFFTRRPLRLALFEAKPERRIAAQRATVVCAVVALMGVALAVLMTEKASWLSWLIPSVLAGAVFLKFDLQQSGREQAAEVAGAVAFAWLPAVFAALAGWQGTSAFALGTVMLARAVPTVLTVRSSVRARKTGERRVAVPIVASFAAVGALVALTLKGWAPWAVVVLGALLACRAFVLLVYPRPQLRASVIGMIEALLGVLYALIAGLSWRGMSGVFH